MPWDTLYAINTTINVTFIRRSYFKYRFPLFQLCLLFVYNFVARWHNQQSFKSVIKTSPVLSPSPLRRPRHRLLVLVDSRYLDNIYISNTKATATHQNTIIQRRIYYTKILRYFLLHRLLQVATHALNVRAWNF